MFSFNPSVSFYVVCEIEAEIDRLWAALAYDGKVMMPLGKYPWSDKYGWIQDKYGISWQLTLGRIDDVGQKISPVLMFTGKQHGKAETAIEFYTSLFANSGINLLERYVEGDDDPAIGTVKHAQFRLDSQVFMAMDSSRMHGFAFNEAISLVVSCKSQSQVDHFWNRLLVEGGEELMCGWLRDRFGLVWQVIPVELFELLADPDPGRAERAAGAMMKMRKIEIEKIRQAANGEGPQVVTVQTTVQAPVERVWEMWTRPEHIVNWNFAIGEWHAPRAENDLQPGGKFNYRMEARDGSMGFDFAGTFTVVNKNKALEYTMDDGRQVQVHFTEVKDGTFVMENFEAETANPVAMQKQGWQAILENFRKYVENN